MRVTLSESMHCSLLPIFLVSFYYAAVRLIVNNYSLYDHPVRDNLIDRVFNCTDTFKSETVNSLLNITIFPVMMFKVFNTNDNNGGTPFLYNKFSLRLKISIDFSDKRISYSCVSQFCAHYYLFPLPV